MTHIRQKGTLGPIGRVGRQPRVLFLCMRLRRLYFGVFARLKFRRVRGQPRVLRRQPLRGDAIGKIELPTLGRSYYVVEGTNAASLRRGPGHYPDTPLPGEHGTTAIAGHRTTHGAPFRTVDKLHPGDRIALSWDESSPLLLGETAPASTAGQQEAP